MDNTSEMKTVSEAGYRVNQPPQNQLITKLTQRTPDGGRERLRQSHRGINRLPKQPNQTHPAACIGARSLGFARHVLARIVVADKQL